MIRFDIYGILVGIGVTVMSSHLQADDALIPQSLPKAKQDTLSQYMAKHNQLKRERLLPPNAKITNWNASRMTFEDTDASATAPVREYLAAIVPHQAPAGDAGPDKTDIYWFRPHVKKGANGVTVKQVVDLNTGKQVGESEVLLGYPCPLTREEKQQALELAKEQLPDVKKLFEANPDTVRVETLLETVSVEGSANALGNRVAYLRFLKKDVKSVAAAVNLTTEVAKLR